MSPGCAIDEAGTSPNWDGDTEVFLESTRKKIVFCLVPSHVDIGGNEKADLAAKAGLNLPRAILGIPYSGFKFYIWPNWQDE